LSNLSTVSLAVFRGVVLFFSNAALTVRFITKRFIGDYDPTLGKQVFNIIIIILFINIIICVMVGL
uniref:Uncharacterized protein n=2 Tax=Gopherus TaxID=38771 RepID=A0A8C4WPU7_9SAUR